MNREYIRIEKPQIKLPYDTRLLKKLDDEVWKDYIFYYLLLFYKKCDRTEIKSIIDNERKKSKPSIENRIARYIRNKLNQNKHFNQQLYAFGENSNDQEVEGFYDITIHSSNWKNKNFHFECKNLNKEQAIVNKYVCYNKGHHIYDGGVYRFFNGKYAQASNFGGMIGFVLEGDVDTIQNNIVDKLKDKFDITPEGDLMNIIHDSIHDNTFTFDSFHRRNSEIFVLHHLLFDLSI